ncbi:ABC transporter permease [Cellulomonas sp. zg-Y338]|uniref:ABC transporter permease n=1 Tax=Cellulomonas chengniuliangii TaxID=2968084 RepID=A0ABY5KYI3_9CELL|nr:ABC transporter permease [Cellulomonas chengniuliangii]MCC2308946.1 ABC transporter permease [Cellulomonas chengniuliangii]MCC2319490.1 ABC transporter permease [Cellulomonas chengniuliangii]UUI74317.1 ABC transporter permease [Cellulomonas chengniuliangii]
MDVISSALAWLNDPLNWTGPNGVLALTREHITISAVAVLLATVVALPVGVWLGHRGRGGVLTVVLANTSRALPTFALLTIFASTGLFGATATTLAVAIFAAPPILTNAYVGMRDVDADVRDAARGVGMSGLRSLFSVELPLALPLIAAGLRTAAVQVVATVPLAALVGGASLGTIIVSGLALQRYGQVVAGAVLVAALCLLVEGALAWAQRALTPVPMRPPRRRAHGVPASDLP